jgi:hypothetical protein
MLLEDSLVFLKKKNKLIRIADKSEEGYLSVSVMLRHRIPAGLWYDGWRAT